MGARHDPSMALRLICLMLFKFLGWTVLRARAETAKEIEILVLRHQLAGHCCIGRVLARAGWADVSPACCCSETAVQLRRVPVPARSDHPGAALVPLVFRSSG